MWNAAFWRLPIGLERDAPQKNHGIRARSSPPINQVSGRDAQRFYGAMPGKVTVMSLKLKVDEQGHAVLENGHPVYIFPDGTEKPLDVPTLYANLGKANNEAKERRLEIQNLEKTLEPITEAKIEDIPGFVASALKALDTVKNLDDKQLVDAKKVEELKKSVSESWEKKVNDQKSSFESKIAELNGVLSKKEQQIRQLMIEGAFDRSRFLKEKTVLPPDIAHKAFGDNFKIEEQKNGTLKLVAFDTEGNQLFSEEKPGADPDFEEAISILVNRHPQKDFFLRSDSTGGGTPPAGGGGGKTTFSKKAWQEKISSATSDERKKLVAQQAAGDIQVT